MASIIKIKRSEVSGNPAVLGAGELAYSGLADNGSNGGDRLYIGMGTETAGNAVNHVVIGGKYFTDQILAATDQSTGLTLVKRDANGSINVNVLTAAGLVTSAGISTGSISASGLDLSGPLTSSSYIVADQFQGSLVGNAQTASGLQAAMQLDLYGDVTGSFTGVQGYGQTYQALISLPEISSPGTYGSTTQIPIISIDSKGRVTGVQTASISTSLDFGADAGSGNIGLGTGQTLSIIGGTGVTTEIVNNAVRINIGQAVNTDSNVTFGNVSVTGTLYSDDITAQNVSVDGNVTIVGDLTVQGTTTTVNSTTVNLADANITIASGAFTPAEANGAGITVQGANASLTYSSADDRWNLNKALNVSTVYGNLTGTVTGSLTGNADTASKWATQRLLAVNGDGQFTLAVDGSQNVLGSFTLSTVNATTGGFGYASISQPGDPVLVPYFVVNDKGLITAASSKAIPLATTTTTGLAKFDGTQFTVTNGAASLTVLDGGTY